ncbi:uncharacterized protein si:dkey-30c15.13 [Dunckerocampus dactyliophorus]|uniref:uncharacterized protein si:dkey-30c15.13 n=1 Tax=Dunckerocampus dactyliophorus TaxID=161453 RepID=UPI0024051C60|nr:uncharacterized protein si:dkey-30c15.13 [Dunckerocampus dactyliophorus]
MSQKSVALNTKKQLAGSYVAKWSSVVLTAQCLLLSLYILLLSWRGLRRYGPLHVPAYSRVAQDPDDTTGPLLEQVDSV